MGLFHIYPTVVRANGYREEEKMRRWNEIKIRQHRLKVEADQSVAPNPAHIENIMRSGFSMTDIKGIGITSQNGALPKLTFNTFKQVCTETIQKTQ